MDKVKYVKLEQPDGSYSDNIPLGASSDYIDVVSNGETMSLSKYITDNNKIIAEKIYHFDTVEDMVNNETLLPGDVVETLGYYTIRDGGGATYVITTNIQLNYDDGFFIELASGLTAELLIPSNNIINFRMLGARDEIQTGFDHHDNKQYLQKYLTYVNNHAPTSLKLYIPEGYWCFSETSITTRNINIIGDWKFCGDYNKGHGTVITSKNAEQRYVWKLGGNADFDYTEVTTVLRHLDISDLTFSSGVWSQVSDAPDSLNRITRGALYIDNMDFSMMDKLQFNYIDGVALGMSTCWEIYFNILNFRWILNYDYPCISIDPVHNVPSSISPNISAIDIYSMMFEVCNGDYFLFQENCGWGNCNIHYINTECSPANKYIDAGEVILGSSTVQLDIDVHQAIFSGVSCGQTTIECITISGMGKQYHRLNNKVYMTDTVIKHVTDANNTKSSFRGFNIGILSCASQMSIPTKIIYQPEEIPISYMNNIRINSIQIDTQYNMEAAKPVFDVQQYNYVSVGNIEYLGRGGRSYAYKWIWGSYI